MDKLKDEKGFRGFEDVEFHKVFFLDLVYRIAIEKFECTTRTSTPQSSHKMEYPSLAKCFEESYKSFIVDSNDSGYISQNVESNSSTESTNYKEAVYVNEDTLLEQPQLLKDPSNPKNVIQEEHKENDNLFYLNNVAESNSIVNSSVVSQNSTFSGLNEDESDVSDVSGIIPVATPITISFNNPDESDNDINNLHHENVNYNPLPSTKSNCNIPEINPNLNETTTDNTPEETSANNYPERIYTTLEESRNYFSAIQSRIMEANNGNMSLFESFYSFVCDLYTRNNVPWMNAAHISIDPRSMHLNNFENNKQDGKLESPHKNSYVELQTKRNNDNHTTVTDSITNQEIFDSKNQEQVGLECCSKNNLKEKIETCTTNSAIEINNLKEPTPCTSVAVVTPVKQFKNPVNSDMSPELFSDDEQPLEPLSQSLTQINKACKQLYVVKNDQLLLKRTQKSLCGVPPPPSVTFSQLTVNDMLQKIKDNKELFVTSVENCRTNNYDDSNSGSENSSKGQSLLVTCNKEDFLERDWPRTLQYRYHGLHHNRSKYSEDFEHLCLKYAERYIGAETQSSCTVFGVEISVSPSKRKYKLKRIAKSPGKRLSHLARRRITFSKDSLQANAGPSSYSFIGARTRQIMVDARKFELLSRRRSPRKKSPRKTPGKSPRRKKTPSSSAKKRLEMRLKLYGNEDTSDTALSTASTSSSRVSATKRALFQSPVKGENSNALLRLFGADTSCNDSSQRITPRRALFPSPYKVSPSKSGISSIFPVKRKPTPKTALFKSPSKNSQSAFSEISENKKRKRTDAGEEQQPSKISRTLSADLNSSSASGRSLNRSLSFTSSQLVDITEHRKKKLMWTVAEALRSQNIDLKHPQFKVFASVLARIIRHFLPHLFNNGPKLEGSTTESMLRIARQYVFSVTRGKTVDQIIREAEKNSIRVPKPTGYIGLDRIIENNGSGKNKENILQDKVNTIGDRPGSESRLNKGRHGENVERIRRVINFDVGNR